MATDRLRITSIPTNYSLETLHSRKKKSYNRVPLSMKTNHYLTHPDLTKGQKTYLWSICSIYSTSQMKQLIQDQFIHQLFYEMSKGIIRTADWNKYLEYLADPKRRKHQFQGSSRKIWKAPPDQFKFRYYRDHPVDLPRPMLPLFVDDEVRDWTKTPPPPPPKSMQYVTKKRRNGGNQNQLPGIKNGTKVVKAEKTPEVAERPHTSMGLQSDSSNSSIPSYSSIFSSSENSSSNSKSEASQVDMRDTAVREGITRPKSRFGRRLVLQK